MPSTLIRNAQIVNEGQIFRSDVFIKDGFIAQISNTIEASADIIIDADGKYLIPGVIDDQVHFREPGLTHKAEIYTESKAAVAGGITAVTTSSLLSGGGIAGCVEVGIIALAAAIGHLVDAPRLRKVNPAGQLAED